MVGPASCCRGEREEQTGTQTGEDRRPWEEQHNAQEVAERSSTGSLRVGGTTVDSMVSAQQSMPHVLEICMVVSKSQIT